MFKRAAHLALAIGLLLAAPAVAQAQYTFVGQWALGDGPIWNSGPVTMSGTQTAAFLFGGTESDYVTSTLGTDFHNIDFLAWMDQYGIGPSKQVDTFVLGPNYTYSGATSAYVCDNAYDHARQYCAPDESYQNYAFRINTTPEPASFVLMGTGMLAMAGIARRKKLKG